MKDLLFDLIDEQKSPLFRIMSLYNHDEPGKRQFDNNITAFHLGNGYVMTVAHNLRLEAQLVKSIGEEAFQETIIAHCNENEKELMNSCYRLDTDNNKRYLNITDKKYIQPVIDTFKRIKYDARWITQYERGVCKPFLIIQFKNDSFYDDPDVAKLFQDTHAFPEPAVNAYTYLIELELVKAFYAKDIAVYKMVNVAKPIIAKIPVAEVCYEKFGTAMSLFCLQASPSGSNLGRLVNESNIEGVLDHHAIQNDRFGGSFIRHGFRYLLKGYFRFGSSGAPYFIFHEKTQSFKVNAIQSEASPIQLSIKNDRNGNYQYINAIASPLAIIEEELRELLKEDEK